MHTFKKQISLVITFHNKTFFELERLLKSLENINKNIIDIIFIYREANEEILNLVKEWTKILPIEIIKINSGLKNAKILTASKHSNSKYIQVVDPDDIINSEILNIFAKKTLEMNSDVILNTHFQNDELISEVVPKNHSLIFKSELISKKIENKIKDNEISQDIYFCGMIFFNTETFEKVNLPFYHYIVDKNDISHMSSDEYMISKIDKSKVEYESNLNQIKDAFKNYNFDNKEKKRWAFEKASSVFEWRLRQINNILNKKNNAIISWWPDSNLGDDILAINFVEKTNFKNYFFLLNSLNESSKKSFEKVTSETNKNVIAITMDDLHVIKNNNENNFFIQIGGSVWSEFTINSNFEKYKKLKLDGFKMVYFGNNLSVYNNDQSKTKIMELFSESFFVSLRDSFSMNLSKLNSYYYDPIYSMDLNKYKSNVNEGEVSINVAYPDKVFNFEFSIEYLISQIKEGISTYKKENKIKKFKLISFHDRKDLEILQKLKDILVIEYPNIEISIYKYNDYGLEIIKEISSSDFIINTRFHSIVISNVFQKNSFNISYDTKNKYHLLDIGFRECEIEKIGYEKLNEISENSNKQFIELMTKISLN